MVTWQLAKDESRGEILEQKRLGKMLFSKDEEKLVKQIKKASLGGIDSTW